MLVMARAGGKYVAGALNLLGKETIYGRNWGSYGDYKFLHFECCYYRAIEFAIDARAETGRGRRARPAQAAARLSAGADLQRPLDPRPGLSPRRCPVPARERDMVEHKIEGLAEYLAVPAAE